MPHLLAAAATALTGHRAEVILGAAAVAVIVGGLALALAHGLADLLLPLFARA